MLRHTEVALGNFKVGDMYSKFGARSRGLGLERFSLFIAIIVRFSLRSLFAV